FRETRQKYIIISMVKLGILTIQQRSNVAFTRRTETMVICTGQAFVRVPAASTFIGQLATALGPQAWV
ncbi:hypothetical protein EDC04DRAFT_2536512, partial [Pisolithus marmoratus]